MRSSQSRHITWHSGARRSSHPPRRSSQSRHINLALGGLPKQPHPEAFFAVATHKLGTRGLAEAATPRGVLRNRDTYIWHSRARRSSHPPRRSSQSRHINLALGGSPKQPPPEAFFAIATHKLGTRGLGEAATPEAFFAI